MALTDTEISPVGWVRSIERNPTIEDQGDKYTNTYAELQVLGNNKGFVGLRKFSS